MDALVWGFVKTIAALAFVLGAFALGVFVLRRASHAMQGRSALRITGRVALSARVSVVELRYRDRVYLVLVGPEDARPLSPKAAWQAPSEDEEAPCADSSSSS